MERREQRHDAALYRTFDCYLILGHSINRKWRSEIPMSNTKHIVKRAGHSESYDTKKLYASVYAACGAAAYQISVLRLPHKRYLL